MPSWDSLPLNAWFSTRGEQNDRHVLYGHAYQLNDRANVLRLHKRETIKTHTREPCENKDTHTVKRSCNETERKLLLTVTVSRDGLTVPRVSTDVRVS